MPDEVVSSTIVAGGTGVLRWKPIGRYTYVVRQVSHTGTITGATAVGSSATAVLRKAKIGGAFGRGQFISRTVAQGGVVAGEPPVEIQGGVEELRLEYSAATVGAAIEMTVFYDNPNPH